MIKRHQGLTLPELLIALAITSVLCVLCLPISLSFYENKQLDVVEKELSAAIQYARNMAMLKQRSLVLTPMPGTRDWSAGIILFIDNKTHQYSENDQLIQQWSWEKSNVSVTWHGFYSKQYLLFTPTLRHSATNGHFNLQSKAGKRATLVVNRLGRVITLHKLSI